MVIEIQPLQNFPQYLPQLAQWHHQEWRKYSPTSSLQQRQQRLEQHLNTDPVPQTFVALLNDQLVGCASLVFYQFGPKTEQLPWLTNVYVVELWRRRGFGSRLLEHAESYIAQFNFQTLKLFTADKSEFYQQRGYCLERRARMSGYDVDIMTKQMHIASTVTGVQ